MKPGDKIEIINGPFAGGQAVVQNVEPEKGRIRVQMLVLGHAAPFTLGLDQVKLSPLQAPDTDTARLPAHGHS